MTQTDLGAPSRRTHLVIRDAYFSKAHWSELLRTGVRMAPLLASLIAPVAVLLDIPALTQPWYGFEKQPLTDETTSLVLSTISLALNLIANALLLVRFSVDSRWRYTLATRLSTIFWILKAIVAIVNLILFGATKKNSPGYIYLQGFWCAVVSCALAGACAVMLIIHYLYEFNPAVALKNNEVRLRGRGLMTNVTLLTASIGLQGLVLSRIEDWTYLDAIYFSTVSILTVGFGDMSPSTTAGKIVLFPFVLLGIGQLAVVVSEIIDFFSERTLNIVQLTKDHIDRERIRKELALDGVDLNQEIKFLEEAQREEDNRNGIISLFNSLLAFLALWFLGALIFSRLENWTYGNGLYFNYVFFLTIGYGDFSPTSSASRVVFIVYALFSVPIVTSFAVQSITQVMSLFSERRYARRKRQVAHEAKPIAHHVLVEEATADLVEKTHMSGLEDMLIDSVLRMDFTTRKVFSASLQGHNKLLMKADTLVQLRNSEFDHQEFVDQFHNVSLVEELAKYRKEFAKFLATASTIKNLQGEERRHFERRLKARENEAADESEGRDLDLQRTRSCSKDRSESDHNRSDTDVIAAGQIRHQNTMQYDESKRSTSDKSDEGRSRRRAVLQSKGLTDSSKQRDDAEGEGES